MAKISIIIPVYNVEKYLQQCIDSLLSQTLSDIEIICIDDASQDASGKILNDYAARDDRMKVIHADENMGTLRARIKGITDAAGQYVMFVDSDDYLEVSACEELLKLLTEHPVDVLHFGTVLHANENVSDDLKNWVTNFLTPYEGELEGNLIEKCFVDEKFDFNITNKIWRREVCEEAFANVEQIRLVASEDRYIFFLLMYYAKNYYGIIEKYYNYNLGIGVTGGDILSLDQFEKRRFAVVKKGLVARKLGTYGAKSDNQIGLAGPGNIATGNLNIFSHRPAVGAYEAILPTSIVWCEHREFFEIARRNPDLFMLLATQCELSMLSDRLAFACLTLLNSEQAMKVV